MAARLTARATGDPSGSTSEQAGMSQEHSGDDIDYYLYDNSDDLYMLTDPVWRKVHAAAVTTRLNFFIDHFLTEDLELGLPSFSDCVLLSSVKTVTVFQMVFKVVFLMVFKMIITDGVLECFWSKFGYRSVIVLYNHT